MFIGNFVTIYNHRSYSCTARQKTIEFKKKQKKLKYYLVACETICTLNGTEIQLRLY